MDPAAQHIHVAVGANTHVNLVINQTGKAIVSQNIEFAIGEGANVNVTSVQAWDDETVHIGSQQASLGKDSTFKHVVSTYGGSLVRLTPITRFAGEGATTSMCGLYFADAGRHLERTSLTTRPITAPGCALQGCTAGTRCTYRSLRRPDSGQHQEPTRTKRTKPSADRALGRLDSKPRNRNWHHRLRGHASSVDALMNSSCST